MDGNRDRDGVRVRDRDRDGDKDRDGVRNTERDMNIDKAMDPAEIYADGSDTPWKFVLRGMIPRRNLFRVV
jgi:hypothetical protein